MRGSPVHPPVSKKAAICPQTLMPKGAPNSAAMYGISLARNKCVVNLRRRRRIFSKTFAHST